jgi:uncharacterized protein YigA (DUF484 family)
MTNLSTLDADAVAQYLIDNPGFFEEHAALLGQVQLTSPLTGRAVSLQERQMEVMRGKYKTLEFQMADLIHTARDNNALHQKFHRWVQAVLAARNEADLPRILVDGLQEIFSVPQATLRMWRLAPQHQEAWFAHDVSDDARLFANSLATPYCGPNNDFEAVRWLAHPETVQSTVILPLRLIDAAQGTDAFGLLILGAEDPQRFAADMATDFLINIGETASAALTCLLD